MWFILQKIYKNFAIDDGAADHLTGLKLPSIVLGSTNGETVDLSKVEGKFVVYCYPRTIRSVLSLTSFCTDPQPEIFVSNICFLFRPDQYPPKGWNDIPGKLDEIMMIKIARIIESGQVLVDAPRRLAHFAKNTKNYTNMAAQQFLD